MMVMGDRAKTTEKNQGISSAEIKNPAHMGGRLDLNDLRKRAKEEEYKYSYSTSYKDNYKKDETEEVKKSPKKVDYKYSY